MTTAVGMGVVIATARRERLLRETLESLAGARLPASLREVRVVENGARSGAREVLESFADRLPVRYAFVAEPNKCRALNHALSELAAPLVYFLDDDVRLDEGTVEAYADAATRYGPGHHFSGPLVPAWEVEPPDWLKGYLPRSATGWYHGDREKYYDKPDFIGSNWAAFRDDILAVGGFSEDIGPGTPAGAIGDEAELQERLLKAGGRGVYLPDARIRHHVPASDCSFEWARDRQHRMGVTYGYLGWPPEWGPIDPGVPGWSQLGVRLAKVSIARALRWSEQRRVHVEMTSAYARGYVKGRRLARHRTRSG